MAAAARAGLGEQSYSSAAQTVGNRLKEMEGRQGVERDSPVSLKPVTYSVGAVLGEAREGPQAPPRYLRLQEGYILEAFNPVARAPVAVSVSPAFLLEPRALPGLSPANAGPKGSLRVG